MGTILYVICWFFAIAYAFANVGKIIYRQPVHWACTLLMAAGWTGVITHLLGVWG